MDYSDYLINTYKIAEYDNLMTENCQLKQRINELESKVEKLDRENFGLHKTIENLSEKLWKRNENFKGEH